MNSANLHSRRNAKIVYFSPQPRAYGGITIKNHYVVISNADGNIHLSPLKPWLRENPQSIPQGLHPDTDTSHRLRSALRRNGWGLQIESDRVLLIRPENSHDEAFIGAAANESSDEDELLEAEEVTFGLEADLQAALRSNIEQLENGLIIIDDGKERSNDAGRIDITAEDLNGNIVVIELKAGIAKPDVIAQILAYMATIGAETGRPVRGLLVAGAFHKRVVLASRAIPNLDLKKYSFQFKFSSAE